MEKLDDLQDIKLVQKLAWSFQKTTGLAFEELYAEALLAYAEALNTFDKERKMKRTTYLYPNISNALKNYIKKENKYKKADIPEIANDLKFSTNPTPFWEVRELLSEDAKYVADKIIDNPYAYITKPAKYTRGQIVKELREVHWKWQRIWGCFAELKNTF